jgi:hypothetical protein
MTKFNNWLDFNYFPKVRTVQELISCIEDNEDYFKEGSYDTLK